MSLGFTKARCNLGNMTESCQSCQERTRKQQSITRLKSTLHYFTHNISYNKSQPAHMHSNHALLPHVYTALLRSYATFHRINLSSGTPSTLCFPASVSLGTVTGTADSPTCSSLEFTKPCKISGSASKPCSHIRVHQHEVAASVIHSHQPKDSPSRCISLQICHRFAQTSRLKKDTFVDFTLIITKML